MHKHAKMTMNCVVSMCFLLCGCITSNSQTGLSAKESRMSEELLRSQVLRYKAEVEREMATIQPMMAAIPQSFFDTLAPADSPFTPEISASIATAFAELAENDPLLFYTPESDSLLRYHLFYEQLKDRGEDMTGLELDPCIENNPWYHFPLYYYEPVSPPIKEQDFRKQDNGEKDAT